MLDFPIVDAHVPHMDVRQFPRPWLDGLPTLNRTLGPAKYHA